MLKKTYFCTANIRMNKKLAIYFLLSLMTFHTAGFYLVFEVSRFLVKHEMSQRISSRSNLILEKIVVYGSMPELTLIGETELKYDDKMYDVVYSKIQDGCKVFYCVQDEREDFINHEISRMMKDHTTRLLIPVFGSIAVLPVHPFILKDPGMKVIYPVLTSFLESAFRRIPENPPENC
jgi:hypothetical protein